MMKPSIILLKESKIFVVVVVITIGNPQMIFVH